MTINEIIEQRGIRETVHFTTSLGLTGILHQRLLKANELLRTDDTLKHILKITQVRNLDPLWKGYVNLSITRPNSRLFTFSRARHLDVSWRILVFSPAIMTHEGVYFVTTNNGYPMHLKRGQGPDSLEMLFAAEVRGLHGTIYRRTAETPACNTTDSQAEILYPQSVSTDYLQKIVVPTDFDADSVAAKISALAHPSIPIEVNPAMFES